ncbi:uncharacterized protein [Oryza sativa Japonica Group]|uniref:F-box domain containing protein n=2 Tax=Oryza sativa subsp. japonica TaxID=39947 RepID=A0A8J8YCL5_ORYSJ|nr:F-box domain containing protein [Oryza sativa Japonica Group]ABF96306.1 F-box domain containing protein [Oryza sativa Japonica Group]EAZ27150.1 hypothetical protein OsJ_11085 [Oryza sativa Japonica Group]KAF2939498.1 hypothetical protein DAI22_03g199900 [Oryza sativa Japonica Group]USI00887.1 F-box domain-containing protein [Oryza sativa Japonica Group]
MELLCDDLLDSILLRLDSPVCLIRAASVCKRWRRVVAADDAAGFLRRIRSLHRPTVYGHYSTGHEDSIEAYFHSCRRPVPFFLPSLPASVSTGHDFLRSYREILDSCGTLLLLRRLNFTYKGITVYEPLTRRCRVIDDPPAPWNGKEYRDWGAYLLGCRLPLIVTKSPKAVTKRFGDSKLSRNICHL